MKWIPYEGNMVPLPRLAEILGLERATLALRWRQHEAGELTMEEVLSPKRLPSKSPTPKKEIDVPHLRELLRISEGDYPPVAAAFGVTRSRVQQMVEECGLTEYARALRRQAVINRNMIISVAEQNDNGNTVVAGKKIPVSSQGETRCARSLTLILSGKSRRAGALEVLVSSVPARLREALRAAKETKILPCDVNIAGLHLAAGLRLRVVSPLSFTVEPVALADVLALATAAAG